MTAAAVLSCRARKGVVGPWVALAIATTDCGGTLDAGWDEPVGRATPDAGDDDEGRDEPDSQLATDAGTPGAVAEEPRDELPVTEEPRDELPVTEHNPVVLCNDGYVDNWQGEYAVLLANTGGPPLAGIIINDSWPWPELEDNIAGWEQMVTAARESGLVGIPDPVASTGPALSRPDDGDIDSTVPNRSEGAQLILEASERLARSELPLVVVTGGRLTDVADAYLMDHTLPERAVVVSSLGGITPDGGEMGVPNGEMDTWADIIVAKKFRYVQVSAFYGQGEDVPDELLSLLPENAFTSWVKAKQPDLWEAVVAVDQVALLAVAVPEFVSTVTRVEQEGDGPEGFPGLSNAPDGSVWLVTEVDGSVATALMRKVLLDPNTFGSDR